MPPELDDQPNQCSPQDAWCQDPAIGVSPDSFNQSSGTVTLPEITIVGDPSGRSDDGSSDDPNMCGPAPDIDENSDSYKQGYQDGTGGKDAFPAVRIGSALAEYNEGYYKGRTEFDRKQEEEREENLKTISETSGEIFDHIVIDGVVHVVAHVLHLGGGIYSMLVAMTVGMECDTRMYRFKCGTCGEEGNAQCTQDEAQADADKHLKEHPDHQSGVSGPGTE